MSTQSAQTQAQSVLRERRESLGLSVRRAAKLAGIDPSHLSRAERGQAQLSVDALARLAEVLGMRGLSRQLAPFRDDK